MRVTSGWNQGDVKSKPAGTLAGKYKLTTPWGQDIFGEKHQKRR